MRYKVLLSHGDTMQYTGIFLIILRIESICAVSTSYNHHILFNLPPLHTHLRSSLLYRFFYRVLAVIQHLHLNEYCFKMNSDSVKEITPHELTHLFVLFLFRSGFGSVSIERDYWPNRLISVQSKKLHKFRAAY